MSPQSASAHQCRNAAKTGALTARGYDPEQVQMLRMFCVLAVAAGLVKGCDSGHDRDLAQAPAAERVTPTYYDTAQDRRMREATEDGAHDPEPPAGTAASPTR
jgi:hypothetical protein